MDYNSLVQQVQALQQQVDQLNALLGTQQSVQAENFTNLVFQAQDTTSSVSVSKAIGSGGGAILVPIIPYTYATTILYGKTYNVPLILPNATS